MGKEKGPLYHGARETRTVLCLANEIAGHGLQYFVVYGAGKFRLAVGFGVFVFWQGVIDQGARPNTVRDNFFPARRVFGANAC